MNKQYKYYTVILCKNCNSDQQYILYRFATTKLFCQNCKYLLNKPSGGLCLIN